MWDLRILLVSTSVLYSCNQDFHSDSTQRGYPMLFSLPGLKGLSSVNVRNSPWQVYGLYFPCLLLVLLWWSWWVNFDFEQCPIDIEYSLDVSLLSLFLLLSWFIYIVFLQYWIFPLPLDQWVNHEWVYLTWGVYISDVSFDFSQNCYLFTEFPVLPCTELRVVFSYLIFSIFSSFRLCVLFDFVGLIITIILIIFLKFYLVYFL